MILFLHIKEMNEKKKKRAKGILFIFPFLYNWLALYVHRINTRSVINAKIENDQTPATVQSSFTVNVLLHNSENFFM